MANPPLALIYVRQSVNKGEEDNTSPERQRDQCIAAAEKLGMAYEVFEDVGGHRSGKDEENRPQMRALKARIVSGGVSAVIVTDKSRLYRHMVRMLLFLELLTEYEVTLYLAAADRPEVYDGDDFGSKVGITFDALKDESVSMDARRKGKNSVKYRKGRNITIGIPPAGTVRNRAGRLVLRNDGAWLLQDGTWQYAQAATQQPAGAVWRGYAEGVRTCLEFYGTRGGYERSARHMNAGGWPFRDRYDNPRRWTADDVRRVVSNWPQYAGFVTDGRGKERIMATLESPLELLREADPARAVFPLELLRCAAERQQRNSLPGVPRSKPAERAVFPLTGVVWCAQCERDAAQQGEPKHRTALTGRTKKGQNPRYDHGTRRRCTCRRKSVLQSKVEGDVRRLIGSFSLTPESLNTLQALAFQVQGVDDSERAEAEARRTAAMSKHRRALANLRAAMMEGEIDRAEYIAKRDEHQRALARLEQSLSEPDAVRAELSTAVEFVNRLSSAWDEMSADERQVLLVNLFERIAWDFDAEKIVSFEVKPWAARYLDLRAALEITGSSTSQYVDPNGTIPHASDFFLRIVYRSRLTTAERDARICQRYAAGEALSDLARAYNISPQRIHQIVNRQAAS